MTDVDADPWLGLLRASKALDLAVTNAAMSENDAACRRHLRDARDHALDVTLALNAVCSAPWLASEDT